MELNDGVSPAILKGEEDPGYLALIMPMKIFEETGQQGKNKSIYS